MDEKVTFMMVRDFDLDRNNTNDPACLVRDRNGNKIDIRETPVYKRLQKVVAANRYREKVRRLKEITLHMLME